MQKLFFAFLLSVSFSAFAAETETPVFKNISSIQKSLGFKKFYSNKKSHQALKVAVLDKGFDGYDKEVGVSLPDSTFYIGGPITNPQDLKTTHGLRMAQILTALATNNLKNNDSISELYLYNAFGFSNFQASVDDAIKRGVDLILYSEVWEYGGNYNGRGFINAQVTKATKAGILWVNAAGNFGLTTYNSGIKTLENDWVQLPDQNNALTLRCEKNNTNSSDDVDTCNIKVVLSWNDFKDDVELGTKKDLDLALTDDMLNVVQTSALKQSDDSKETRAAYSKYPREIITAEVKPGTYFLRVKNRSKNFTGKDRLRITVDGENITMPSHSTDETLLNPADNSSVITVGASDSDRSSFSQHLGKPDISAPSSMILAEDDSEFRGSSNSAAIVAAGLVLVKSQNPKWDKTRLLNAISNGNDSSQNSSNRTPGLSLNMLRFYPTNGNCFRPVEDIQFPDHINRILDLGGVMVETTQGARIMLPFDPIQLVANQYRRQIDDMVVLMPNGNIEVWPRLSQITQGAVEVFQRPLEAGLCYFPSNGGGKSSDINAGSGNSNRGGKSFGL